MSEAGFGIDRGAPAIAAAEGIVKAPPEAVWALLTDIEAWPAWNKDVKEARLRGPLAPGSEFTWKAGPGTIRSVLRAVEPPRRIGWTGKTLGINASHVWEIEAVEGGSRVRTEESWNGFIVRLLKGMMQKQLQKSMDGGLAYLKSALES